ncbi:tyrosine-type recombinase/integrase [Roseomonas sp. OT10]|uniref:tyrosine-type recombinase/integrase n=1 Tax=Roseomonas cutis TaxID=2897332 RepID=UPI001E4E39DF|nr:tyrosine-type recombinase/integrase [Roseomonas sp. OT10]UFN48899.1 tyrosine-type recombinase/integrase [Roseomonas sp. OT10]
MAALAVSWYSSARFTSLTEGSQDRYRRIFEELLKEHRDDAVAGLQPAHIRAIVSRRAKTPAAARALLNVLRQVLHHAFDVGMRGDVPTRDVRPPRYKAKPHATWTEEDIAAFEAKHPLGTRARLALALLLYTGQRSGDVIRMGPQHVQGGAILVRQQKTGKELAIPKHSELEEALAAHPGGHLAFLMTQLGAPFASQTAFYNWFRRCAADAGVTAPPHGLRKATCCRLAEAGCTPHEISSITGQSLKMVEHYTREVNQRRVAARTVPRLARPARTET